MSRDRSNPGYLKAKLLDSLEIERLLELHFDREAGRYRMDKGQPDWTDARIAEAVCAKLGRRISKSSVGTHRTETGRYIRRPEPTAITPAATPDRTTYIAALENQLSVALARVAQLEAALRAIRIHTDLVPSS